MTTPHTPGTAVAQAVNVTLGGTKAKYHAVGIHDTNVAIAITGLVDADDGAINEANAKRIAACWGYCEGLDTEGMQRAVEMGRTAKVFIDESIKKELELLAQRDELREALEFFLKWGRCQRSEDKARAAIAKTEEAIT